VVLVVECCKIGWWDGLEGTVVVDEGSGGRLWREERGCLIGKGDEERVVGVSGVVFIGRSSHSLVSSYHYEYVRRSLLTGGGAVTCGNHIIKCSDVESSTASFLLVDSLVVMSWVVSCRISSLNSTTTIIQYRSIIQYHYIE
jgi:hypothetical protein